MSLKIEVYVPEAYVVDRSASTYLSTALSAIGFFRRNDGSISHAPVVHNVHDDGQTEETTEAVGDESAVNGGPEPEELATSNGNPARERGKAAPGRTRRTNAEIAEDKAADERDAAAAKSATAADLQTNEIHEAKPAISTGEERAGPEDSPADQEQDAADEAAETAAERDPEKALTLDDVRTALGAYVKAYGMAAAQEDGPKVITLMFGEGKAKVSDIPDDQASLAKAVEGITEMTVKNPFKRAVDL